MSHSYARAAQTRAAIALAWLGNDVVAVVFHALRAEVTAVGGDMVFYGCIAAFAG